ncbi:hypothetical protein BTR23_02665 [Alkalihalophilus pseudofirmus]|nr:hypothetical protein BTR23_02665 [Alkalihalophilus pseudofirmus]
MFLQEVDCRKMQTTLKSKEEEHSYSQLLVFFLNYLYNCERYKDNGDFMRFFHFIKVFLVSGVKYKKKTSPFASTGDKSCFSKI